MNYAERLVDEELAIEGGIGDVTSANPGFGHRCHR